MKKLKCFVNISLLFGASLLFTACPGKDDSGPAPNPPTPINNGGNSGGGENSGGGSTSGDNEYIASSFSGSGTQTNPYIISKASELRKLAKDVNEGKTYSKQYFKMTANIIINRNVLNSNGTPNSNTSSFEQWTPIGNSTYNTFCGVFDGNGYSISGIYAYGNDDQSTGLFGYLAGEVKNLSIDDSYIKGKYCGGIAGTIVTYLADPKISKCTNHGYVEGQYAGGIIGQNEDSSCSIDRCINYGTIVQQRELSNIGGIGGLCNKTTITNCVNIGTVGAKSNFVLGTAGGITAVCKQYGGLEIKNCVNFGSVICPSGSTGIGSIASIIDNCVNYGDVYYGICYSTYRKSTCNSYFLNVTCTRGVGVGGDDSKLKSSQCISMTRNEMQKQSFLDELNKNARNMGADFAKWKFGKDGCPSLDL